MTQNYSQDGREFIESPPPIAPEPQDSLHPDPDLHPSLQDDNTMAQSPTEAASGAKSNHEILRRMSLTGSLQGHEPLTDLDPRAAHPSLNLSGSVISATFCIPHSLQYRKGSDWVRRLTHSMYESLH